MRTTYDKIHIAPFQIESLEYFKITKKINDHVYLSLRAILKEEEKDKPVFQTAPGSQIEVTVDDEGILFKGMVTSVKVQSIGSLYYLKVEAASNTMQLDIKRKSRSFQDKALKYEDLVNGIASEYGTKVIDTASKGKKTEKFLMQYDETNWRFIMRLASHFNQGLIPVAKDDSANFHFGLPEGATRGNLEEYEYTVVKRIIDYMRSKENHNKDLMDTDHVFYEIETDHFFNIGDIITYQSKTLYIYDAEIEIKNAVIKNIYKLSTKKGCDQDQIYNEKIIGLSLQGEVLEAAKDELKMHLCIDEKQDTGKAHFFQYTTAYTAEGNSGFYCMPELKDTVFAYFPSEKEWEGVSFHGIRTREEKGDKISDPDIKYLRTKYGKELKFAPDEILVTCIDDEIYIKLNEEKGIEIFSKKPIKVHTKEDLTVDADKQIYLTAKDKIMLKCKSSSIQLDGNVTIKGKEVRNN